MILSRTDVIGPLPATKLGNNYINKLKNQDVLFVKLLAHVNAVIRSFTQEPQNRDCNRILRHNVSPVSPVLPCACCSMHSIYLPGSWRRRLLLNDMYAFKIACWALIFIFRLRFPSGVSIATILKRDCYLFLPTRVINVIKSARWLWGFIAIIAV